MPDEIQPSASDLTYALEVVATLTSEDELIAVENMLKEYGRDGSAAAVAAVRRKMEEPDA